MGHHGLYNLEADDQFDLCPVEQFSLYDSNWLDKLAHALDKLAHARVNMNGRLC